MATLASRSTPPAVLLAVLAMGANLGLPSVRTPEMGVASVACLAGIICALAMGLRTSKRPILLFVLAASLMMPAAWAASPVGDGYLPVEPQSGPKHTWVVGRGDHFWSIAAAHVAGELAQLPTAPQIATYWRSLVEANLGVIRSGDPDLIHPGEVLELP